MVVRSIHFVLHKDKPFLGTRRVDEQGVAHEYVWSSHNEIRHRIESYGRGLVRLGLGRQEALGVYSVNRAEWVKFNRLMIMTRAGRR